MVDSGGQARGGGSYAIGWKEAVCVSLIGYGGRREARFRARRETFRSLGGIPCKIPPIGFLGGEGCGSDWLGKEEEAGGTYCLIAGGSAVGVLIGSCWSNETLLLAGGRGKGAKGFGSWENINTKRMEWLRWDGGM